MRAIVLVFALTVTPAQVFAMDSLADLEWKNRVVLIFGNHADTRFERQIDLLTSETEELADRDMVLIRVEGNEARAVYGTAPGLDALSIRKEAGVNEERFEVILVGKDGGIKSRSETVVESDAIFGLIDSMPMRKAGGS